MTINNIQILIIGRRPYLIQFIKDFTKNFYQKKKSYLSARIPKKIDPTI
jgi:hypothetical protein